MKISPSNQFNSINKTNEKSNSFVKSTDNEVKDKVHISDSAKAFEAAMNKAKVAKTDKKEQINSIKKEINDNRYNVNTEKLANKIVDIVMIRNEE